MSVIFDNSVWTELNDAAELQNVCPNIDHSNVSYVTFFYSCACREVASTNEASPSSFFERAASQSNLHNLGQIGQLQRGLSIHDMTLEQPGGQYDDSQKKAKLEVNMGFASSSSNGAAAAAADEETAETFTNQSDGPAHGSTSASNWHQAAHHQAHHAQAYASSQYPNGFFHQVL